MIALLVPTLFAATAPSGAGEVIQKTVDEALRALRDDEGKTRADRVEQLKNIAAQAFDWQEMAKRSLGVHWRKLGDRDRERFVEVFKSVLADRYSDDLDRFQGTEKVLYQGEEPLGKLMKVKTILITHSRDRVPIDYFLHRDHESWRVHDISVEGVSIVNHYRGTFSRFLANRSFEELMERLEHRRGRES